MERHQSPASTTISPKPGKECLGRCGAILFPTLVESAFFSQWVYGSDRCPGCSDRHEKALGERRERERIESYWPLLGGRRGFQEYLLDRFVAGDNATALSAAKAFDHKTQNIYIHGPCGVGKSHLAYGILRHVLKSSIDKYTIMGDSRKYNYGANGSHVSVYSYKPMELLRHLRGLEPDIEAERLDRMAGADVFLLDDLGVGRATEFSNQMFYEIIERRHMDMRGGLIVTSNLSLSQLAEKTGDDRLSSRLSGMCGALVFGLQGKDRRVFG